MKSHYKSIVISFHAKSAQKMTATNSELPVKSTLHIWMRPGRAATQQKVLSLSSPDYHPAVLLPVRNKMTRSYIIVAVGCLPALLPAHKRALVACLYPMWVRGPRPPPPSARSQGSRWGKEGRKEGRKRGPCELSGQTLLVCRHTCQCCVPVKNPSSPAASLSRVLAGHATGGNERPPSHHPPPPTAQTHRAYISRSIGNTMPGSDAVQVGRYVERHSPRGGGREEERVNIGFVMAGSSSS